jgi:hypothetical protein
VRAGPRVCRRRPRTECPKRGGKRHQIKKGKVTINIGGKRAKRGRKGKKF